MKMFFVARNVFRSIEDNLSVESRQVEQSFP